MWCPSCNSRSPLVSVQHGGIFCARCEVEVVIESAKTGLSPHDARQKASAETDDLQDNHLQKKQLQKFPAGKQPDSPNNRVAADDEIATIPLFPLPSISSIDSLGQSDEPIDQKLFRFDGAHERRALGVTATNSPSSTTPLANSKTKQKIAPPNEVAQHASSPLARSSHSPTQQTSKNNSPAVASPLANADSPRVTMSIGLFFAGQSLVVWSFFTGNVLGLAAGMVIAISAVGVGYLHLASQNSAFGENRRSQPRSQTEPTSPQPPTTTNDGKSQTHIPRPQNLRKRARPKIPSKS